MSVTAAAVAGGAALASGIFSGVQAGKMNRRAVRFQREMFEKQGARELEYWNLQNQYNAPIQQMERLKEAGLNPNLVYGKGADAQSAPLKAGGAPNMPPQHSEAIDLSSVAQTALAAKQLEANISRTEAETDRIRQGTAIGQFELEAMRDLGQGKFTQQLAAKVTNATNQDKKQISEYESWLDVAWRTTSATDGNIAVDPILGSFPSSSKFVQDSVTAATKKAVMEIENIKSGVTLRNQQHSINELRKILLQAEAEFTKAVGSKAGAGMALQLLRTILGR